MERIFATYLIETPLPVAQAAASLAGEQSSGTFVEVPGETAELRRRFEARVEKITELETVPHPALPGGASGGNAFRRAEVMVSWSLENVGYNLPALVSTVQGNLYELKQFSGLKLMDLELPASFAKHFRGPQFGIAGTRRLTGVEGRPLIGTIIKPSVGLTPAQTAALVKTLAEAGIDFVKDDELMADPPHSPFDERVDAVMAVINSHAARTGKKVMYAFNISDEIDAMRRHYEKVAAAGGTAVMVSLNSVGLSATKKICDLGALAVHGHRNGWGMLNRHPFLGIEFPAYQKIWRLAGIDQIHVNGIQNKFWESDDSVERSIKACLQPMFSDSLSPTGGEGWGEGAVLNAAPLPNPLPARSSRGEGAGCAQAILPVVSSGQWGGQAPETYRRTKTIDLLYLAGGGIMAHPGGPADGVKALRQAWEGAVAGLGVEEIARKFPEFAQSVKKFGGKN